MSRSREQGSDLFPIVVGTTITLGVYAAIPSLPAYREFATRYLCGHPLEYVTTGLFFIGLSILGRKFLKLGGEKRAFRLVTEAADEPLSRTLRSIGLIDYLLAGIPTRSRRTAIAARLRDVSEYLDGKPDQHEVGGHLKYLAELAAERMHGSYAFLRTITWAVPILGFLGTVMGITIAIANINPEQLNTSLGEVTGGLAVAFDTTALALALSLILVFANFMTERAEQSLLDDLEEFGISLSGRLGAPNQSTGSQVIDAEAAMAERFNSEMQNLLGEQAAVWRESLEQVRTRWMETIESQQTELAANLKTASMSTLAEHSRSLAAARHELIEAVERCTSSLTGSVDRFTREADARQTQQIAELRSVWTGIAGELKQSGERLSEHHAVMREQTEQLSRLMAEEAELARLQKLLADNLETLQVGETFEQSINSLTGAVHLLTSKAGKRAA